MTIVRRVLPLTTTPARPHPGGRSASVCHYRCGDACSKPVPNPTDNEYFGDILNGSISRRSLLVAGAAATAFGAISREVLQAPSATAGTPAVAGLGSVQSGYAAGGFTPIAPVASTVDAVTVPTGFTWSPIIRWGDPLLPGAPGFDFDRQSPGAQSGQFGYNNDYTALIPSGRDQALLVCNHEYTNEPLMFRGWTSPATAELDQLEIAQLAHGMSVVGLHRCPGGHEWTYSSRSRYNRRITVRTAFTMTGPAAGSSYLRTPADPTGSLVLGTLNNCAGGVTPWGTVLSGEENIDQYFAVPQPPSDPKTAAGYTRYGITSKEGRSWQRVDDRFDTTKAPNEPHRFGWVVEVDPHDPTSTPRKHTALGRMKHEGATVAVADDGRVVVYMGDDERFDYLYKFVSRRRITRGQNSWARKRNQRLLEEGDLYVAKFTGEPSPDHDGGGTWLPLVKDGTSMISGMTVAEVLIWTRLAADRAGATKMDRPEDVEPNPVTGTVYLVCTNNDRRTTAQLDGANPRAADKNGHVIEIEEHAGDAAATSFRWKILLLCGTPEDPSTYFAGFDKSQVSPISCPDNVTFDRAGNLWIATDGQPSAIGYNDALHLVPTRGPQRGRTQQFLAVPTGAETCGPVIAEDRRSVLVAVQHPGDVDGATPQAPASTFPYDGSGQPRPSVIQVNRLDGKPFLPR